MSPRGVRHNLEKAKPNQRNPQLKTKRQLLNEMSRKEAQIVTLAKRQSNVAGNVYTKRSKMPKNVLKRWKKRGLKGLERQFAFHRVTMTAA